MVSAPGNAADLGLVYGAPVPVFSWTGCYIGSNTGRGWGRETVSIPNLGRPEIPARQDICLRLDILRRKTALSLPHGFAGSSRFLQAGLS